MKKSFVLLLALVIFVSGTACYAQNELLQEKDKVYYEEKVVYGDKSVVDGVTVEVNSHYNHNLFWNTVYKIGEQPKMETDYTFHSSQYYEAGYEHSGSIDFVIDCTNVMSNDYDRDRTYHGLQLAMKELYDETEPGTENTQNFYLKDYVEYYTFGLDVQLPNKLDEETKDYYDYSYLWTHDILADIESLEKSDRNSNELKKLKRYLADMTAFQEFFKIPVLDTEVFSLAIAKDENGNVIGMGESSLHGGSGTGEIDIPNAPNVAGADSFSFRVFTAFTEDGCYMTFDPRTSNDNIVDVSHIPGGFGIYHFNYDKKEGTLDLDTLKLVHPLDVNTRIDNMFMDASGENIILITIDAENYYLSVIDQKTMTLVDTFSLGDSESYLWYWTFEDYMLTSTDQLMVFPIGADGRYTMAWSVEEAPMNEIVQKEGYEMDLFNYNSGFDWNGETLLITSNIEYFKDGYVERRSFCDFFVAAVDETGLLYYGEYYTSLATSDITYNPCQLYDEGDRALSISWK